jgi:DNA-binding CsgD family transcriptional regulator
VNNINHEQLLVVIDQIYQAAADPNLWPVTAEAIRAFVGGHSATFAAMNGNDEQFNYLYSPALIDATERYFIDGWADRDIYVAATMADENIGKVLSGGLNISGGAKALAATPVTEGFYQPNGCFDMMGVGLQKAGDVFAWYSVAAEEGEGLFTLEQQQRLQLLVPHLQRALQVNQTLVSAQSVSSAMMDAIDKVSVACAVIGSRGEVIFHNRKLEQYCADGLLDIQAGHIALPERCLTRLLDHQLANLAQESIGGVSEQSPIRYLYQGCNVLLQCLPYKAPEHQMDWLSNIPQAMLFISTDDTMRLPAQPVLEAIWGLTKAEYKVLAVIVTGLTVKEVAEELSLSEHSVRFHLKNIFSKTDCNRQADLIIKLYSQLGWANLL